MSLKSELKFPFFCNRIVSGEIPGFSKRKANAKRANAQAWWYTAVFAFLS